MLRVQDLRLARAEAEEAGVEQVGVGQYPLGLDVAVRAQQRRPYARGEQFLVGREGDALAGCRQVLPEGLHVGGARETPGQSDDGDVTFLGVGRHADHPPIRDCARRAAVC